MVLAGLEPICRVPLLGDGYNHLASIFCNFSDLTLDAALEEGDRLNELSRRPEYDRTFSVMSRKALYAPMMETIKPYRDKLIQAKRQLDQAWKGETVPVVTSSQPDDVHELRENLSRVSTLEVCLLIQESCIAINLEVLRVIET